MSKKLFNNSLYNVIYKFLNVVYPLISSAYLARVLLPDDLGKVVYAHSIVSYFTTAASLGLPTYGIKCIAGLQQEKNDMSKAFWELFIINACSTIVALGLYALFIVSSISNVDEKIAWIFCSLLILNLFNIDWLFQGVERYGYIAARSLLVKCLALVLLLVFVKSQEDYKVYAWILCFATGGNYILNMLSLRHIVHFKKYEVQSGKHMKSLIILLASSFATELYMMLDLTIIGAICTRDAVAYYSNATKLVRCIYTFIMAVVAAFLPRMSALYKEGKYNEYSKLVDNGLKISLLLAIPSFFGVYVLAEPIVLLFFGEQYRASIECVQVLSILIVVFSINYISGISVLTSVNCEKLILHSTLSGAVINAILNVLWIGRFGILGAAVSSVLTEIIVTIISVNYARKYVKYDRKLGKFISQFVVSGIVMAVVVLIVNYFCKGILGLIIGVVIGVITYFGMLLWVLKNEYVVKIFQKVIDR